MIVPNLDPVNRNREYNNYTEAQRDRVIYHYLFVEGMTNRNIDEKLLGLNCVESKGYQSMGILHHLGLKNPHKGIFINYSINDAINILTQQNAVHFKKVIDSLSRFNLTGRIPQVFDSWDLLDDNIALKTVDKSVFADFGTDIPIGIRSFFEITNLGKYDKKTINLTYNNKSYTAIIEMDSLDSPWSRIIWKAEFRDLLHEEMHVYYDMFVNGTAVDDIKLPKIRFSKIADNRFEVDFIYITEIEDDIKEEIEEDNISTTETAPIDIESEVRKEGKVKYIYGKQYERDPKNRVEAIKFHGTKCVICAFDFEKMYGTRGKGYIEIHHVKPLSSVGKETDINPKTDLLPVCSNCHKMIHRRKDKVLSIEEMKQLIIKQRNRNRGSCHIVK